MEYEEITDAPDSQTFNQMQPYLAMNMLIASDFINIPSPWFVGELLIFAAINDAVPENGLIPCDGAKYDVNLFPLLYGVVQDKYFFNGTHFGVPDCNGKTLISIEDADIVGESQGIVNSDNIPSHDHLTTNIPLTSDGNCTAQIDVIDYDEDCVDVNNIMPVLPVLFVLHEDEFRLWIGDADQSAFTVTYLDGVLFGSTTASFDLFCRHIMTVKNIQYKTYQNDIFLHHD